MTGERLRILVTGGTGFIGRPLLRRLVAGGHEVHAISRREMGNDRGAVHWIRGDLLDAGHVQQLVAATAPQVIVHLASLVTGARGVENVLPTLRSNLLSAVTLMVAAVDSGCRRLVLAGSMEEPDAAEPVHLPGSPYAAAKWAASGYARMFHALYGLDVVPLRIAMTYGPGQADSTKLVPYVIGCLLRGDPPRISSGSRAVDWVYVEDVAAAIELACFAQGLHASTIDVASGRMLTIREIVERLSALVDPSVPLQFGAVADRTLERPWKADVKRVEALLGWHATTSLDRGLAQTVAWYRDNRS